MEIHRHLNPVLPVHPLQQVEPRLAQLLLLPATTEALVVPGPILQVPTMLVEAVVRRLVHYHRVLLNLVGVETVDQRLVFPIHRVQ